ncbi:MAG TPA: hypothetical protein VFA77_05930, partial [Candidatus Eisenbacteria bacterium]|nr:hypothetical protein [Candidatus Eisenbacteria bacterium]
MKTDGASNRTRSEPDGGGMKSLIHRPEFLALMLVLMDLPVHAQVTPAPAANPAAVVPSGKPITTAADQLAAGLVAEYRSLGAGGTTASPLLSRIEAKPAFTLLDASLHPRIPPGPFAVRWSGMFDWRETEPTRFGAFVCGEVSLALDGVTVLAGKGTNLSTWIEAPATTTLQAGLHRLEIQFRPLQGTPARVQLWWEGKSFLREPIPAWRLKH